MARDKSDPIKLLDLHRNELVRDIFNVRPILDSIYEKEIVTEQEMNAIIGVQGDNRHRQARRLLDVVKSKGLDAFLCFREVLGHYCPYLEDLLRHCPIHDHNSKFMFWCEQCECLQCEICKNEHGHPEHDFTAIFSITENIKTKFDCFIRESRSKLTCVRNRQISSTEDREYRLWAETSGLELRTLVNKTVAEEVTWFVTKLSNQQTPSVIVQGQGQVNTGELKRGGLSDRAAVGQEATQRTYDDAADLRTLLRRNRRKFVSDMLYINPIVDVLCQKRVLTQEEESIIVQTPSTPQNQARSLLDIIACKGGIEALHHFAKALETTYPHLAELLHQCPVHNAKFEFYCEDCKVIVCQQCRDRKHTDHSTTSTTTIVTMCKSEFDRFILDNRDKVMDIRRQNTGSEEQEKWVRDRGAELRDMITRKIDEEVDIFKSYLDQAVPNSAKTLEGIGQKRRKRKKLKLR